MELLETPVSCYETLMGLEQLKLKEISLFLDLVKTRSIRELSRQRNEPPGQISKGLRSLELKLKNSLLHRSAQGVTLTAYAIEIMPILESIRDHQLQLEGLTGSKAKTTLTVATTSFFSTHFVPKILGKLHKAEPETQCELIDLPPNQFIPVALRNGFEVCIHMDDMDWPKTWTSMEVGKIHWHLVGRKGHPLSNRATMAQVLKYPFTYPIYWTNEGKRYGEDQFPVPIKKRLRGYETATAISAAQIIAQTDQLGFLPDLVAEPLLKSRELSQIEIPGLKPVTQKVFLSVKSDSIKQKRFEWLKNQCKTLLDS